MQLKNISNKIFLVFGGLHVSIILKLKTCCLRKKVKIDFFKWHHMFLIL